MLYLAIDQHRKQLTVNLRNESGDVILKRQVSTQCMGVPPHVKRTARTTSKNITVTADSSANPNCQTRAPRASAQSVCKHPTR